MSSAAVTIFARTADKPHGYVSNGHCILRIGNELDGNCVVASTALPPDEQIAFFDQLAQQAQFIADTVRVQTIAAEALAEQP